MMLEQSFVKELSERHILEQHFPMLARFGIPDADVLVHSHLLSYLVVLGSALGYAGIVECPIVVSSSSKWIQLGDVRSDCIWFDKEHNSPRIAFEVERFEPGDEGKLRHKVENLAIANLRAAMAFDATVLIYWLRSGASPRGLDSAISPYVRGFTRNGILVPPTDCPLHTIKCVLKKKADVLVISDLLLAGSYPRVPGAT